jgi:hypothetical protein
MKTKSIILWFITILYISVDDVDGESAKQMELIQGGGHNNSALVGGKKYLQAVKRFFDFADKVNRCLTTPRCVTFR